MKNRLIILFFIVHTIAVHGQTTWNQDIAPIIFNHCTTCHHEGGIAPTSYMSYDEAIEDGIDIRNNVLDEVMPPWPPDPNYVHFKNERVLSTEEIDKIVAWASEGYQEGTGTAPTAPTYADDILMPDYDLSIDLPEFTVTGDEDIYRTFVIHSGLTETKYINASEFIPDNTKIIHHMLIYADTSDISWQSDQDDPGPGYASNGTTTSSPYAVLVGAWAPGDNIYQLPAGMGIEVPAGSDFAIEIHFAPDNDGESAAPQLHLKWSDAAFTRPVWVNPILYHFHPVFQEPVFYIPANTVQTFHEIYSDDATLNVDLSFISVAPHMHYLGQTYLAYAKTNDNDSIPLINVDDWDFHWQYSYTYQKLVKIPAYTDLYGIATYDNTSANEDNPNDPPQDVWLGEQTTDEMMLCFFAYTFYLPGDEDMVLDSSILETSITDPATHLNFFIYPNPASDIIQIVNQNPEGKNYYVQVMDMYGRIVLTDEMQYQTIRKINISQLPNAMYFISVSDGNKFFTEKILKASPGE